MPIKTDDDHDVHGEHYCSAMFSVETRNYYKAGAAGIVYVYYRLMQQNLLFSHLVQLKVGILVCNPFSVSPSNMWTFVQGIEKDFKCNVCHYFLQRIAGVQTSVT